MSKHRVYLFTRSEFLEGKIRAHPKHTYYKKTRNLPGVYVLFDIDHNCRYVGQSHNIQSRLNTHLENKDYYNILVLEIPDESARDALEPFLRLIFMRFDSMSIESEIKKI